MRDNSGDYDVETLRKDGGTSQNDKPISQAPLPTNRDRLYFAIITLGVLAAIVVRWFGLGRQSLWWDEGYTVFISQFPLKQIWRGVAADTSPPLYYFLLHGWVRLFGISEISLRGMSAFLEMLSIPVFLLLAKKVLNDKAAVAIAMWLSALSAFQVHYAQDARFYGLLVFFSLVSVYSLIRFLEKRSTLWFITLALSIAGGLYTHNMMFFYLPGLALLWLFYPSDQSPVRRALDSASCGALVLLLYLPWLPHLLSQTRQVARVFWAARPSPSTLSLAICSLSGLDVRLLSTTLTRHLPLAILGKQRLLSVAGVLVLLACVVGGLWRTLSVNQKKVLALVSYAVVPILIVFFYSRVAPSSVFIDRAFIASSVIFPLIIAAPIAFQVGIGRRSFIALGAGLLVASSICLSGYFSYFSNEDWRGMTAYVAPAPPVSRAIVFAPLYGQVLFDYYATRLGEAGVRSPETGLPEKYTFDDPVLLYSDGYPTEGDLLVPLEKVAQSGNFKLVDVVVSHPSVILAPLQSYLQEHCTTRSETNFNGITVVRCTLYGNPG